MGRRHGDLITAALLAGIGALVVAVVPNVAVRIVFAVPLLLILPGYAVSAAVFGRGRPGVPHLLLLSFGLSLSTAALGGLLLDLLPFGLRSRSWSLFAVCVTWAACGIAVRRRAGSPGSLRLPSRPRLRVWEAILLISAGLIAAGAVAFARTPLPAKNVQGYTALWLLPVSDHDRSMLRLGVTSAELHQSTYRVEVREGQRLLYGRHNLSLQPGQTWQQTIEAPSDPVAGPTAVTARLYRSDDPSTVYRRVRVWLKASVSST